MLGDLNAGIGQAHNPRSQKVVDLLMDLVLANLLHHFRQRWWFCHMKKSSQVRQGILLRERCDHILGMDRRQFEMVGIRDVRNYSSDNFALQARLLQHPTQ